ncbi:MAG: Hint domain-containing protein [Marinibacterium sp.]
MLMSSHAFAPATQPVIRPNLPAPVQTPENEQARPQLRRYRIRTLHENGDIREEFQLAPALPVFEEAFSAFARGSMIDTEVGPMAIEDLLPGDRVAIQGGQMRTVRWIGSTIYVPGHASHKARDLHLTRIMADSFGLARPSACILTGPAARLRHGDLTDGDAVLTPVRDFIDNNSVIATAPPAPVELFHICLDRHAVIKVGGLDFETYHPGADAARRLGPSFRPLFLGLFPHISGLESFGPLTHARAADNIAADIY